MMSGKNTENTTREDMVLCITVLKKALDDTSVPFLEEDVPAMRFVDRPALPNLRYAHDMALYESVVAAQLDSEGVAGHNYTAAWNKKSAVCSLAHQFLSTCQGLFDEWMKPFLCWEENSAKKFCVLVQSVMKICQIPKGTFTGISFLASVVHQLTSHLRFEDRMLPALLKLDVIKTLNKFLMWSYSEEATDFAYDAKCSMDGQILLTDILALADRAFWKQLINEDLITLNWFVLCNDMITLHQTVRRIQFLVCNADPEDALYVLYESPNLHRIDAFFSWYALRDKFRDAEVSAICNIMAIIVLDLEPAVRGKEFEFLVKKDMEEDSSEKETKKVNFSLCWVSEEFNELISNSLGGSTLTPKAARHLTTQRNVCQRFAEKSKRLTNSASSSSIRCHSGYSSSVDRELAAACDYFQLLVGCVESFHSVQVHVIEEPKNDVASSSEKNHYVKGEMKNNEGKNVLYVTPECNAVKYFREPPQINNGDFYSGFFDWVAYDDIVGWWREAEIEEFKESSKDLVTEEEEIETEEKEEGGKGPKVNAHQFSAHELRTMEFLAKKALSRREAGDPTVFIDDLLDDLVLMLYKKYCEQGGSPKSGTKSNDKN